MLPIDSQSTNEYINALKAQFGQIRRAENKSVYFTTKKDTGDSLDTYYPLLEDYKILDTATFSLPDNENPLDTSVAPESGLYQIWSGSIEFIVTGTGVLQLVSGVWLIPTGIEVTVTQNGSVSVPGADTFLAVSDPVFMYVADNGEGAGDPTLPYRGKAFYGHLTLSDDTAALTIVLIRPDRTYHSQQFTTTAAAQDKSSPVFFTHIFCATGGMEIYFTGKELTFVDADYPADAYVAPTFVYVPD